MKEKFSPIQIIKNKLRRKTSLGTGPQLCYKGEIDGHFQIAEIDKIPQDQEIVLFEQPKQVQ